MAKKSKKRDEGDAGEVVQSPPYPYMPTPNSLYEFLVRLRTWVLSQRDDLNNLIGQQLIPDVREFPERAAYATQPIPRQMQHIVFMQVTRKQWDQLICMFEHSWDCAPCVRQRAMIVQRAAIVLNDAFTPEETREFHSDRLQEQQQRAYEESLKAFTKFVEYQGREEKESEEG